MTEDEKQKIYENVKIVFDRFWHYFKNEEERLEFLEMVKKKIYESN